MVQTSLKHEEKPSEYLIYSPLLHIITNRPPCRYFTVCIAMTMILKVTSVPHPEERCLVFDVEVAVTEDPRAVMAAAVTSRAWYSWLSPQLLHGEPFPPGPRVGTVASGPLLTVTM